MGDGTFVAMVRGQAALNPDGSLRRFPTEPAAEDYVREQDARPAAKAAIRVAKRAGPAAIRRRPDR